MNYNEVQFQALRYFTHRPPPARGARLDDPEPHHLAQPHAQAKNYVSW
jgi:hypothetical protein